MTEIQKAEATSKSESATGRLQIIHLMLSQHPTSRAAFGPRLSFGLRPSSLGFSAPLHFARTPLVLTRLQCYPH